jgi:hypothetical protein
LGATVLAMVSMPVPGVNGTTILMDWPGQDWAQAAPQAMDNRTINRVTIFIRVSLQEWRFSTA